MKILGLVLLLLGLVLIGWTLYHSYNVFTGKAAAPDIFSAPEAMQLQPEQVPEEGLGEFFPVDPDALPEALNMFAWGLLAFVLIFGGSQIAGLGIKLMK